MNKNVAAIPVSAILLGSAGFGRAGEIKVQPRVVLPKDAELMPPTPLRDITEDLSPVVGRVAGLIRKSKASRRVPVLYQRICLAGNFQRERPEPDGSVAIDPLTWSSSVRGPATIRRFKIQRGRHDSPI